jgi:hypothetical protein
MFHTLGEVDWMLEAKLRLATGEHAYYNYLGGRYNALIYFAKKGNLEMVQWIVQKLGKSVTERDSNGLTVLMYAADLYQFDIVQWLIQYGGARIDDSGNEILTFWKFFEKLLWFYDITLSSQWLVFVKVMLAHGPPYIHVSHQPAKEPLKLLLKHSAIVSSRFLADSTWRGLRKKEIEESDCARQLVPDLMRLVLGYESPSEEDVWGLLD